MLDFIKKNYQVGDPIEITTSAGVYSGQIEFINNKYIVLRQENGKICGIAGSDIFTFKADIPEQILAGRTKWDADDSDDSQTVQDAGDTPVAGDAVSQSDNILDEKQKNEVSVSLINPVEPKVVGHIDLEKLQRIDPKLNNRNYFTRTDERTDEVESGRTSKSKYEGTDEEGHEDNDYSPQTPYVSAKGRVTYFNYERRYGFIHDFSSEADLYFKMSQIAEPMLLDRIRKGTKVVYTADHNAQGPTANCLHLPHPVNTLFIIAENCIDSYKYYFAREILEHVLEVYPDNRDALDMLEEIRQPESTAKNGYDADATVTEQFNPSVIYSQAKRAYLKKEYDEAERLYLQALESKEKPESCVKDLVTLYVSNYKQSEDETVKAQAREKAMNLLQMYRDLLPDNMTTKQFLALNYYLPIGEYEKFIETVDEIMTVPQVAHVVSRRVFYLWQKGLALNKLGRKEEALALVNETLELSPNNRQLLNLKNMIENPESDSGSQETGDDEPETVNDDVQE